MVTKLPVTKEDIPRQSDVNHWQHLEGVSLPEIDAEVELLIGNVPEALQPIEVKESKDGGPYTMRTVLEWTVNGSFGRKGTSKHTRNIIQSDTELTEQFEGFCNQEFNNTKATLSQEDQRALNHYGRFHQTEEQSLRNHHGGNLHHPCHASPEVVEKKVGTR